MLTLLQYTTLLITVLKINVLTCQPAVHASKNRPWVDEYLCIWVRKEYKVGHPYKYLSYNTDIIILFFHRSLNILSHYLLLMGKLN